MLNSPGVQDVWAKTAGVGIITVIVSNVGDAAEARVTIPLDKTQL